MEKRYNAFNQIHKALRAMLYDTAITLQLTDFSLPEEADEAIKKTEQVLTIFHDHATHEDQFILAAVEQYHPGLVRSFKNEHSIDESLTHRLFSLIALFDRAVSSEEKHEIGAAIFRDFNEFIAFNLKHMNREETELNQLVWKHYTDAALLQITKAIVAQIPPAKALIANTWMLKSISNTEVTEWLVSVKNDAPDVAFQLLLELAENILPGERWNKVKEGLTEGALLA
jgi:hypothetical protein